MASINYSKRSPYANTPFKSFYLGIYKDRPITADANDTLISLEDKYKFRPDLLAHDLYGDSRYWWVFIRRNMEQIKDPIFDFLPNIEIYVPSKSHIVELIG